MVLTILKMRPLRQLLSRKFRIFIKVVKHEEKVVPSRHHYAGLAFQGTLNGVLPAFIFRKEFT